MQSASLIVHVKVWARTSLNWCSTLDEISPAKKHQNQSTNTHTNLLPSPQRYTCPTSEAKLNTSALALLHMLCWINWFNRMSVIHFTADIRGSRAAARRPLLLHCDLTGFHVQSLKWEQPGTMCDKQILRYCEMCVRTLYGT